MRKKVERRVSSQTPPNEQPHVIKINCEVDRASGKKICMSEPYEQRYDVEDMNEKKGMGEADEYLYPKKIK